MSNDKKGRDMELNELSIKLASFETEGANFESFLIANPGEQDVLQVIVTETMSFQFLLRKLKSSCYVLATCLAKTK